MAHETQPVATLAPLTNVQLAVSAVEAALNRGPGLPGLICLYGPSGYGKSSAAAYIANRYRAYYIELKSLWSVKHMLTMILREMGTLPAGTVAEQLDQVCETLTVTNRPLILDQADYLVDRGRAQVLMDLYEGSKAPILFIGEERLSASMRQRHNTVHRRVLQWVEAQPATREDCRQLARLYAPGVAVGDDLLDAINARVNGCTGRVALNLHRVGEEANVHGWKSADLAQWGTRGFLTGEPGRG